MNPLLHLDVILERPGATWFRLADGTEVHVYGPADEEHDFFGVGPMVGLAVSEIPTVSTGTRGVWN